MIRAAILALAALLAAPPAHAGAFDAAMAAHPDFSGAVLVVKGGAIVFDKAYGLADAARGLPNRPSTSFHLGSLSMSFTDLAIMHLVDTGKLRLDNTAGQFLPGLGAPARDRRIRDLIANDVPADHVLLAHVAEAVTGRSFGDGAGGYVFASVWANGAGWDDGSLEGDARYAKGYGADGHQVTPDWAAVLGADGAYSTTRDLLHLVDWKAFDAIPVPHGDQESPIVYRSWSDRHGGDGRSGRTFEIDGQGSGFAAAFLARPDSPVTLTVIVLSNHAGTPASTIAWELGAAAAAK